MAINALQKYTRLSQKASQVDAAIEPKAILKAQLADINEKIEELAQAQALLIERLWEQN